MKKAKTHAQSQSRGKDAATRPVQHEASQTHSQPTSVAPSSRQSWHAPTVGDPPLIRVLMKEASRKGHRLNEMAPALGVTYGYIAQLRGGLRKTEHVSQQFAEACAAYCGVPPALIKLWAGRIVMSDFLWPQQSKQDHLVKNMKRVFDDPVIGPLVPTALLDAPSDIQEFVCTLFEESTESHDVRLYSMPRMLQVLQRAAILGGEAETELLQMRGEIDETALQAA